MTTVPKHVRWTDHAYVKAGMIGAARTDIEASILERHRDRRSNPGSASWRLSSGPWVILYDHPDGEDPTTARIVTLWRHR